eukprot:1195229-Prorocentrum_minimum.AAC.5
MDDPANRAPPGRWSHLPSGGAASLSTGGSSARCECAGGSGRLDNCETRQIVAPGKHRHVVGELANQPQALLEAGGGAVEGPRPAAHRLGPVHLYGCEVDCSISELAKRVEIADEFISPAISSPPLAGANSSPCRRSGSPRPLVHDRGAAGVERRAKPGRETDSK